MSLDGGRILVIHEEVGHRTWWVFLGLFLFLSATVNALEYADHRPCGVLVARLALSDDWRRDREKIEKDVNAYGIPEVARYNDVRNLLAYFDIHETPTFQRLPVDERRQTALTALRELAKLPSNVRELTFRAGYALWLVVDNVVEHPRMGAYANVRPRGHPRGTTWKVIAGAGMSAEAPGAIVAMRKLERGKHHGATNLILHEVAHNVDAAWGQLHFPVPPTALGRWLQRRRGGYRLSATAAWRAIHRSCVWPSRYEQKYAEEAFAEAFARYFHGPEDREYLRQHQPEAYAFIEHRVAGYEGPPPLAVSDR